MASRNSAFKDSHLSPTWARCSKGGDNRASSTRGRSQAGALGVLGGRCRKAPLQEEGHRPAAPRRGAVDPNMSGRNSSHINSEWSENVHYLEGTAVWATVYLLSQGTCIFLPLSWGRKYVSASCTARSSSTLTWRAPSWADH